ncbi:hypothetical protein [Streptomyces tauricus]|uniref:hypothetical protein n=1 Tax=Streptomyces tauricus TaxID=68274 RepID=UPI002244C54A|nr:hypothetical protein [Streptomyces tauricus]MCW8103567.1 hypothetical protein [Streptomyces tauricus]
MSIMPKRAKRAVVTLGIGCALTLGIFAGGAGPAAALSGVRVATYSSADQCDAWAAVFNGVKGWNPSTPQYYDCYDADLYLFTR